MASSVEGVSDWVMGTLLSCHQVFSTLDLVVYEGPMIFPSGYIVFTCLLESLSIPFI